ncbi:histidine kinase [Nonomuraea sp. NPDC049607]|uniref:sensor histidine kinase n=1 Tax=Nonomuraea sp. NPDC049607 TaxID=3154732 RepID=UPI00342E01FD
MRRNLPRRWACLILGGALLMPYMMAGVLVAGVWSGVSADLLMPIQIGVFVAVLPVVAVTGLFLPVRGLEVNAAQGLLGARVETPPRQARRSWQERRRTAAWFTVHLAVGGVVSGFTLAVVPFTAFTLALPFVGEPMPVLGLTAEPGWPSLLWAAAGVAALALLVAGAAGAGALLAALAPPLLGPTPAERLAAAEEHARTLAERNRLARELHDSVGHALSVVTLQAAAAGRVLDRDPATARTALAAIEQSARAALEDLDHVLGVLREDRRESHHEDDQEVEARRAPQATLADLGALVAASGADVRQEVGDLSGVPAVVSREAYRIVQEALTNAIRHGGGPVRLAAAVQGDDLRLEVSNPGSGRGGRRPRGGGRGVDGMRERVRLLRGDLRTGPDEGGWTVSVRLPLRPSP